MKQLYIRLENKLLRSKDFTSSEKIFLALLFALTKKGDIATLKSNRWLAVNTGVHMVTLSKMLRRLKERKKIINGKEYPLILVGKNEYLQREISFSPQTIDQLVKAGFLTKRDKNEK